MVYASSAQGKIAKYHTEIALTIIDQIIVKAMVTFILHSNSIWLEIASASVLEPTHNK